MPRLACSPRIRPALLLLSMAWILMTVASGEAAAITRDTPPGPGIRQCAEWEPVTGVLVRYPFGLTYDVLREMAEDVELWVIVANASQQAQCTSLLQANGVNLAHVRYAVLMSESWYTRITGRSSVRAGCLRGEVASGVYVFRLNAGDRTAVRRGVLLRKQPASP